MKKEYYVVQYINGQFTSVISGLGRNKGKWEAMHLVISHLPANDKASYLAALYQNNRNFLVNSC